MGVEIASSGVRELQDMLRLLPDRIANKAVKQSMAEAARIGRDALRNEAEKHNGRGFLASTRSGKQKTKHLADTAIVAQKTYGGDTLYAAVGFSYTAGAAGWLVEHGHRIVTHGTVARLSGRQAGQAPRSRRGLTGAGRVVGQVAPHPIALPAFESIVGKMEDAFTSGTLSRAEMQLMELSKG